MCACLFSRRFAALPPTFLHALCIEFDHASSPFRPILVGSLSAMPPLRLLPLSLATTDELCVVLLPYLHRDQPAAMQACAVEAFSALKARHPDATWLFLVTASKRLSGTQHANVHTLLLEIPARFVASELHW
jgi:hypothetical protein